ncbi:MAG: homocysteine S-methyltransferase family protein [Gammaproteobacteria bacterium]|nr:MAG: homocysteine S-methyltransferase family protein [Gammaproteobacteria bacterium]
MNNIIIGDGALGTELRDRGVEVPSHTESIWSALALTEHPEEIRQIHLDYIEAGSDFITINNYAVTRPLLERVNRADELTDLTLKSIELGKDAIKESNKDVRLAGSLPPLETSYRADLVQDQDKMIEQYTEIASILENEVDIIICETMSSILEAKSALACVNDCSAEVWLSWTLMGNRMNLLPSGENIVDACNEIKGLRADAYLINCCGANMITEALASINEITSKPIGGYANPELVSTNNQNLGVSKQPELDHRSTATKINEARYAEEAIKWVENGASIIAGCCRTRPSYIKKLKEELKI